MFEPFVELFHIIEDLFSRDTAIWMFITGGLAMILEGLNATGRPDGYSKKTGKNGKEKWTRFKF